MIFVSHPIFPELLQAQKSKFLQLVIAGIFAIVNFHIVSTQSYANLT